MDARARSPSSAGGTRCHRRRPGGRRNRNSSEAGDSAHATKLIAAGYVEERKRIVDRKALTEYRLTDAGRKAFTRYRSDWDRLTSGKGAK